MSNVLARKLEGFGALGSEDKELIQAVFGSGSGKVLDGGDVISEGDEPTCVNLVVEGWAYRYKILEDGKRQIVAFMLPGDICDLHVFVLRAMDHSIGTLGLTSILRILEPDVQRLLDRPLIARALLMAVLVDEATLREWIANIGQRRAERRIAHLFCELHLRMQAVGLTDNGRFDLPLSQGELGDTVGLSLVHVNRSLQSMRRAGLVDLKGGRLIIPDVDRLREMSGFRSNYLHLERKSEMPPSGSDAVERPKQTEAPIAS